ncbi:hypothetical protein FRZ44_33540 [Hypericibacter terrae]|uniref:Uncharacterized protein n=1 Tax=Hypericibacter terrae TaxID=2602015 RepID=A0A5J6MPR8_9PROT|nr:hypothetical protein FRZ44_33540 [Hypericibacter terrae]
MIAARPGVLSPTGHREQALLAEWCKHSQGSASVTMSKDAWVYRRRQGFIFGASAVKATNEENRLALERRQPRFAKDQRNRGRH